MTKGFSYASVNRTVRANISITSDHCCEIWIFSLSVGRESEHAPPWGESSPDDYRYANQIYTDPREREKEQHDMNKRWKSCWPRDPSTHHINTASPNSKEVLLIHRLLDPSDSWQFDDFKKCYGEILHRWGMKDKRAEVLKFVSCPPEPHKGIGMSKIRFQTASGPDYQTATEKSFSSVCSNKQTCVYCNARRSRYVHLLLLLKLLSLFFRIWDVKMFKLLNCRQL